MSHLDDLLNPDCSHEAARAVTPPPFETLRDRGVRRRHRRRAVVLGGAAFASVVAVVGVQLADREGTGRPVGGPQPTPTSTSAPAADLSPAEVVDHPEARLRELAVVPGNEESRAAVWQLCLDKGCSRSRQAIAVTGDGFETRFDVPSPGHTHPFLTALSPDAFYVGWNPRSQIVLRTDGTSVPLELAGTPRPLGEGEVLVRTPNSSEPFMAVDPDTGKAHTIPLPDGLVEVAAQPDGTLLGTIRDSQSGAVTAVWSTDGGASWQQELLATNDLPLTLLVPSAQPGVLVIIEGADGATLFPFLRIHRSLDHGASWENLDVRTDPQAYVGTSAVLTDGRLLVDINAWSDQRPNRPSARPVGLYVSNGSDWSDLSPAAVGDPFTAGNSDERDYELLSMDATEEAVAVYAVEIADGVAGDELYVSRDAGQTWEELALR